MMESAPKHLRGFTWIEALLTLAVLAAGCLAVLNLQQSSLKVNKDSNHLTVVGFLAESQLELLKASSFDSLIPGRSHKQLNRYGEDCRPLSEESCYKAVLNISPAGPAGQSRRLSLDISWEDGKGLHSRRFEAVVLDQAF